ncbi:uncharacterized protein SPSK_02874 [Sporothrix schenckii 1099-18]|uniref:Uncharacterized protein n=1 Tax=Sporothrix schenckii 1099-18 TaxID=1397361 RepID=A0A0F2M9N6_SPOSC|nr:uncharacterized protein SPSK_02874 [Sporothrix schenckii 1099-18]KJR86423.1 hypothetical protein SPSK_02874 [Sporothrix schenckii 1099-18]
MRKNKEEIARKNEQNGKKNGKPTRTKGTKSGRETRRRREMGERKSIVRAGVVVCWLARSVLDGRVDDDVPGGEKKRRKQVKV